MTQPDLFDFSCATFDPNPPEVQVVKLHPDKFAPGFEFWLVENRHVWREFKRQADSMAQRGFKHYSARTICEYIRHHTTMAERQGEWKLNNNAVPDLARLYMLMALRAGEPERAGIFETRVSPISSKRAA